MNLRSFENTVVSRTELEICGKHKRHATGLQKSPGQRTIATVGPRGVDVCLDDGTWETRDA
eukprot:6190662-Pleurochrysis_carterae.AAC.2